MKMSNVAVTIRGFNITRLGYHNVDFPIPNEFLYAYKILQNVREANSAQKNSGKAYNDIFMVEKGRNTVFRFSKGEPVRCNPDTKKLMWTINSSNQIAFFRIDDYSKLINGGTTMIEPQVAPNQDVAFQEIRKFSL